MQSVTYEIVEAAINNSLQNTTCSPFHEGVSCNQKALQQFVTGSKAVTKMYLMVHLVPFLLFKRKHFRQNPRKEILKLIIAFTKSILFAGGYTALVRRIVCLVSNNYKFVGYSNAIAGIIAGMALNFEPINRQSQIALFCLNKSMEVVYTMGRRRGWPIRIPYGECLLAAVSLAVITFHYLNNPEAIRSTYLKVMNKVLMDC